MPATKRTSATSAPGSRRVSSFAPAAMMANSVDDSTRRIAARAEGVGNGVAGEEIDGTGGRA
jgi:hypothetical protein